MMQTVGKENLPLMQRIQTVRCFRIRSKIPASSMSAMMRMVAPQRVHLSGSTS